MKRWSLSMLLLVVLTLGSAAIWLVWAQNEYGGAPYCPFLGSHHFDAKFAGVGLALAAAGLVGFIEQRRSGWSAAIVFAVATFCCAALLIGVIDLYFEAGLQC